MKGKEILEKSMLRVPEFEKLYKTRSEKLFIDEDSGPYIVYGILFMPYVIELLSNHSINKNKIRRIFDFFEEMALGDEEIKDVLMYSVLETLGDDKNILKIASDYMGVQTKFLSSKVEDFLGR